MLIALWITNGVLALIFAMAGISKLARPREALVSSGMKWAGDMPDGRVKRIGALELLGAFGLILPLLTGIAPVLTPIASIGLAVVMIAAVAVHVRRKENFSASAVLGVLAIASAAFGFLSY
jgi:hypothetical protein